MAFAGDETVTRVRPPKKDGFGNRKPGTGAPDLPLEGCMFAPGSGWEMNAGANQVGDTDTVFAPYGPDGQPPDVLATDQIRRANGDLYDVIGRPKDWGPDNGVQITVEFITG